LQNFRRSYSQSNYDNTTGNGGVGTWVVTSDQGSTGVYHTVSGQSFCSNNYSVAVTDGSPGISNASSININCWCRMTSPNLGASWVFLDPAGSAAGCASNCAAGCADCVLLGASASCHRPDILELP
jgi:hypothetical protein